MKFLDMNDRYSGLIVSMGGLLAIMAVLLVINIVAASRLEKNTDLIDATNRMATNTQSVMKDLFDLQSSQGEDISSPHMTTVLKRIRASVELNDQFLEALDKGGKLNFVGGDHDDMEDVRAIPDDAREHFDVVKSEWQKIEPLLSDYLKNADNIMIDSSSKLSLAHSQAQASTVRMNEGLENLLAVVHEDVEDNAHFIRIVQILGILGVLVYFVIFLRVIMGRLQESDRELEVARRETSDIMATVNTGLFLLDKDLNIGQQYSKALVDIIGTKRLAGENLTDVLSHRISETDLETTRQFIEQLYNTRVKEKLVNDLNPLNKVMFYDEGSAKNRYLDFKFSRVYEGKEISRILVNVNDVSNAVYLEQRLEKERAQNDMQIEMLTTILNVSPRVIHEFIRNTHTHIDKMNTILKNPGSSQFELETKLKSMYREMHSLKGEASALKLHSFTKIASDAEDKLHALQNQSKLSGNDFLPLTVQLDELLNLSNTITNLGERIGNTVATMSKMDAEPQTRTERERPDAKTELGGYLVQFGHDIAKRQQKQIQVDVSGMAGVSIPDSLSVVTKEICVQLLRNAVVHGIADGQTRIANGRPLVGQVAISAKEEREDGQNYFLFTVEDDGLGIDYDNIRQRLVDAGKYSDEDVRALSEAQLLNTLFSSGFSTRSVTDEDGGRGVGLDIVKDRVKEYGGKISVQSEKGKFARFVVKLPIPIV
ncbi:ATP-binding protein [Moraxella oblonga]|uniref:ATP-binding protein n=1 Tax=Moraxella oblonga TaxID=200413 RepID=UPI00082AAE07|nr:ATP-binding protein [Moraxella oblonga]